MNAVEEWLASGKPALIAGQRLRPRAHPLLPGTPLQETRGQGSIYRLDGDDAPWFLKSFFPARRPQREYVEDIANCIPHLPVFRCGWERRILSPSDLTDAPGMFTSSGLASWLDGTILMPQHSGEAWGDLLLDIAEGGFPLALGARIAIARQLTEAILLLEMGYLSHRDLSSGNILVDLREDPNLSLIDWDTLYHPTFDFQINTTVGTPGYIAPWLDGDGQRSWHPHADRLALAICVAEILTVQPGMRLYGDGSLFEQQQVGRNPDALHQASEGLLKISPALDLCFRQAWSARAFDECPAPLAWLRALASVDSGDAGDRAQQRLSTFECWVTALNSVGIALKQGEVVDFRSLVTQHTGLELLITPGQERLFAQDRAVAQATTTIRRALTSGEDAGIVEAAAAGALDHEVLRPSEVLQIEQAQARMRSLSALQQAIQAEFLDDGTIVEAWWSALSAGCSIPTSMCEVAREAHRRRLGHQRSRDVNQSNEEEAKIISSGVYDLCPVAPQAEAAVATQVTVDTERLATLSGFDAAVASGDAKNIFAAAVAVRALGERIPVGAWDAVARAEARISGLDELRSALEQGNVERAALAWARADSLWRDGLTAEEAAAGREAFRRWGRAADQVRITEGLGDES